MFIYLQNVSKIIEGVGIENEWNNIDITIGSGRMSYSKSFEYLFGETSMTYSITDDGDIEYEASRSICWDNSEYTAYVSLSLKWQIAVAAGAMAAGSIVAVSSEAIPAVLQLLLKSKL